MNISARVLTALTSILIHAGAGGAPIEVTESKFRCESDSGAQVVRTTLGGVPALVRHAKEIRQAPIVLWHGFGPPDDEAALMATLPLDDVPAVKIYLGLPLFGERAPEGGMEEAARRQAKDVALLVFEPVVVGAAKELARVDDALRKAQCLEADEAIGVFGFSAGGAAALFALAERDVPVSAAVTLNASTGAAVSVKAFERATGRTYEWSARSRALAERTDALRRARDIAGGEPAPALLLMHGGDDTMLPADLAASLHDALRPHYDSASQGERLKLQVVTGMAHGVSKPAHRETVRRQVAAWFNTHLATHDSSAD